MKLLVLSDSHHFLGNMYDAIEKEKPDLVIHLGDHASDAEEISFAFQGLSIIYVSGNCDYDRIVPTNKLAKYENIPVFLTHGHPFHVKSGTDYLLAEAKRLGAKIALFGHTHCQYAQERDGILLLNPGSCGAAGNRYAVLNLNNGIYSYQLCICE